MVTFCGSHGCRLGLWLSSRLGFQGPGSARPQARGPGGQRECRAGEPGLGCSAVSHTALGLGEVGAAPALCQGHMLAAPGSPAHARAHSGRAAVGQPRTTLWSLRQGVSAQLSVAAVDGIWNLDPGPSSGSAAWSRFITCPLGPLQRPQRRRSPRQAAMGGGWGRVVAWRRCRSAAPRGHGLSWAGTWMSGVRVGLGAWAWTEPAVTCGPEQVAEGLSSPLGRRQERPPPPRCRKLLERWSRVGAGQLGCILEGDPWALRLLQPGWSDEGGPALS